MLLASSGHDRFYPEKGSKSFLGNVGTHIPNYTESRPRRTHPMTPNDHYSGHTAPLTSKRCILYIYSTNIGTEYFKHGIYSPFIFSLQNAVCFIILTY